MTDEGVCAEAAGNRCVVGHGGYDLRALYRYREGGGIQQVPTIMVPRTRPHIGAAGGRVKDS